MTGMETVFIVVAFAIVIAIIARVLKPVLPRFVWLLKAIHLFFLLLFIIAAILLTEGYRFYGPYTNSVIAVSVICSAILLYGFSTSARMRFYTGIIAWPALISEVAYLVGANLLLIPFYIGYIFFAPPEFSTKINNDYRLEDPVKGIKAPLNNFYLSKRSGLIFEKKITLIQQRFHHPVDNPEVVGFLEDNYVVYKYRVKDSGAAYMRVDTLRYADVP